MNSSGATGHLIGMSVTCTTTGRPRSWRVRLRALSPRRCIHPVDLAQHEADSVRDEPMTRPDHVRRLVSAERYKQEPWLVQMPVILIDHSDLPHRRIELAAQLVSRHRADG